MQLISNPIAFLFVPHQVAAAEKAIEAAPTTKYVSSYLENSIYFLAIAIAISFCCKCSLVVLLLPKAKPIAAANNLQYVA